MNRAHSLFVDAWSGLALNSRVWITALAVTCIVGPNAAWSQSAVWLPQGATTGNIYYNGGNVGIGTTSSAAPLDVRGMVGNTGAMFGYGTPGISIVESWPGVYFNSYYNNGFLFMGTGYAGILNFSPTKGDFYIETSTASGSAANPASFNIPVAINNNGNVGIGTTNPLGPLDVASAGLYGAYVHKDSSIISAGTDVAQLQLAGGSNANKLIALGYDTTGNYGVVQATTRMASWDPLLLNPNGGSVGIGTTDPCANSGASSITNCKLSVAGAIQAQEVVVNTGWSDYVFDPAYHLKPLTEVAGYIEAHRHLPDIPSEAEVKQGGVALGEMQVKLLAKIEELTLHMI